MARVKSFGVGVLAVFSIVTVIVLVRTFTVTVRKDPVVKCSSSDADFIPLTDKRLENFRTALKCQTISRSHHTYNREALAELGRFIVKGTD